MALLRSTALAWGLAVAVLPGGVVRVAAQEAPAETAEAVAAGPGVPVDAGAYLAGRSAEAHGDFRSAAAWFDRALVSDGDNLMILDGSLFANLNLGRIEVAAEIARKVKALSVESQLAETALLAEQAMTEDYAGIIADFEAGREIGPLFDVLVRAWAELGQGRMSEALADFDSIAKTRGMEAFGLYHKAIALALVGDFEGADQILSGRAEGPLNLNRRGVMAHVQILSQLERNPDALALLDRIFGTAPDPGIDALRERLRAGEPLPFDTVRSAREGIAEVFFSIATLLNGEADPAYTLMHSQIAAALMPDHTEAQLLSAGMLEALDQYELAVEIYAAFPPGHPAYLSAEIGRAEALYGLGRKDAAIEALQGLARSHGDLVIVQSALGDVLRREERWAEALPAYDAALALVGTPAREHWVILFSRAICHERLKQYDLADADFRAALVVNPGQPQVLNYLGYSMVERGINLDEALGMIKQAVAAQPDAGYIIDSLAWAYFRLGRYEEALAPMERASLLEPVDPVVTDHLGDVYWAVGRKREAEFQWRRALSFEPEEKDAIRIRRKLEIGLDGVLVEEGAPPLRAPEAAANGD